MTTAAPEIRVDPDGWDPVVADAGGPQLVVAGPGAGQTEFLVRRAPPPTARGADPGAPGVSPPGSRRGGPCPSAACSAPTPWRGSSPTSSSAARRTWWAPT